MAGHRRVTWLKDDPLGMELAEIDLRPDRLDASGVAIGTTPVPYRMEYVLETAPGFVTKRLSVVVQGTGWRRALELLRDEAGSWAVAADEDGDVDLPSPGGDAAALAGAFDCDLGLSPLTNLMPIARHRLQDGGGPIHLTTAWVAVPQLSVLADAQRYTHLRRASDDRRVVHYEAVDGTFAADITVDGAGIVIDYPGIGRQL